jgi:hypothetical protein
MARLRQHKYEASGTRASEGRTTPAATHPRLLRRLVASLAFADVVFAAAQLASNGPKTTPVPAFMDDALGAPQPQAPLTRRPAPDIRYANGTLARTSHGVQAITIDKAKGKVETFSSSGRRLGFHIRRLGVTSGT